MTMSEHDAAVLADLRAGEKAYPIYRVAVRWSAAYLPNAEDRIHRSGLPPLPEGRFWDSTGWYALEREERLVEEIAAELLRDWWPKYAEKHREPADVTITVALYGYDVWCPGWFSHWTVDVGMSDEDVLASFGRYVDRIFYSNRLEEGKKDGLLMGAEDRWRWHGCVDGNPKNGQTEAPCHCPGCKAFGRVRIDH